MTFHFISVDQASDTLKKGHLVALPTETVYGLAATAHDEQAILKIYQLKKRPSFNPLIFHVSDQKMAETLGVFSPEAKLLAKTFWPGPLTLVVPICQHIPFSTGLATAGLSTLAIRMPQHPLMQQVIQKVGAPLVAPSANLSGYLSATRAQDVLKGLAPENMPPIVDGGTCERGLESTILDTTHTPVRLLRYGAVPTESIANILHYTPQSIDAPTAIKAPGQLKSHYAPSLPVRMNATTCEKDEAFLGFGSVSFSQWNLSPSGHLEEAACAFFPLMHQLDQPQKYKGIAVAPIPLSGLGYALNDRLTRACSPRTK